MLLDQIVLQQQGVHFCRGHRHLDIANTGDQSHGFCGQATGTEITGDPVFEILGLADIKQFALVIVHLVHPRPAGQGVQKGFGIKVRHESVPGLSQQLGLQLQRHSKFVQNRCLYG